MSEFRVVAIVSAFNEADVISPVIGHLVENRIDVYLIDNRSTDGTADVAKGWLRKGLLAIEKFPAEPPAGDGPPAFDWEGILRRKEELAKDLEADWFIHHDADEFREAPWPGMNLRDAIRWVDRLGYNCIDFRVLNFPPLEDGFPPGTDPSRHFTYWEDPVVADTLQRKAWKAQESSVSLAASGGHEAQFPDRRVFPVRFLMRHYPIRSQEHGRRKVFDERKKRFVDKERAKGWHVQYDSIAENHSFLGDPAKLHLYDPDRIRLELILESDPGLASLSGTRTRDLIDRLIDRERHIANLETRNAELERHAVILRAEHAESLARAREAETHALTLKREVAELQRHASALEHDRRTLAGHVAQLQLHAANLGSKVAELERHASGLENDRKTLEAHVSQLEGLRVEAVNTAARLAELERHASGLERDRETLAAHISHLEAVRELLQAERVDRAELEGRRLELQAQLEEARSRSHDLEDRFTALRARANREEASRREAERELAAIRQSTSWKVTAPARRLLDLLKRALGT
jgi:glycosyltransferase involved in cell wall biosynthesis